VLAPQPVRRLLIIPLMLVVGVAILVLSPLLALLAAVASPFLGNWRPLRLLWVSLSYLARDVLATLAFAGLWLVSGFGRKLDSPRMQRAHFRILRWFLGGLCNSALRAVRSWVEITDFSGAEAMLSERRRPVLVFARHAAVGDSFLLFHELLNRYGRRPRNVMKALLQWDPFFDLFGNRLPNCFVAGGGRELIDGIRTLAAGLGPDGALLIFPEGGNFSEGRRRRTIDRLERGGPSRRGRAGAQDGQSHGAEAGRCARGDRRLARGGRRVHRAYRPAGSALEGRPASLGAPRPPRRARAVARAGGRDPVGAGGAGRLAVRLVVPPRLVHRKPSGTAFVEPDAGGRPLGRRPGPPARTSKIAQASWLGVVVRHLRRTVLPPPPPPPARPFAPTGCRR
jgi:hypothetical protein